MQKWLGESKTDRKLFWWRNDLYCELICNVGLQLQSWYVTCVLPSMQYHIKSMSHRLAPAVVPGPA